MPKGDEGAPDALLDAVETAFRADPLDPTFDMGDDEEGSSTEETAESEESVESEAEGETETPADASAQSDQHLELLREIADGIKKKPEDKQASPSADPFAAQFTNEWHPSVIEALESDDPQKRRAAHNYMLQQTQQTTYDASMAVFKKILPTVIAMARDEAVDTTTSRTSAANAREKFFTEHEDLSDPDYAPMIGAIANRMFKGLPVEQFNKDNRAKLAAEVRRKLNLADPAKTTPPKVVKGTGTGGGRNTKPESNAEAEALAAVFPSFAKPKNRK